MIIKMIYKTQNLLSL